VHLWSPKSTPLTPFSIAVFISSIIISMTFKCYILRNKNIMLCALGNLEHVMEQWTSSSINCSLIDWTLLEQSQKSLMCLGTYILTSGTYSQVFSLPPPPPPPNSESTGPFVDPCLSELSSSFSPSQEISYIIHAAIN
jgi:hypothetical protein